MTVIPLTVRQLNRDPFDRDPFDRATVTHSPPDGSKFHVDSNQMTGHNGPITEHRSSTDAHRND